MVRNFITAVLGALFIAAIISAISADAQNRPGIQPEGTMVPGHCVQVGSSSLRVQDAGAPCLTTASPPQALAIGATVTGATPGMCLTIDVNGKLAQTSCLTVQ